MVQAVSATGMYECAYSCALDTYLHTSWMSSVSGGPPVISLSHGLFSGLCAVSNLARLHDESRRNDSLPQHGATVAADWDRVSSSQRPPTVLSQHPHFTVPGAQGERGSGRGDDEDPDALVLQAPEWEEQEEQEGVEAEARGGGEGCLWGWPPHLHTQIVTQDTPKLEYGEHAFDIRRWRPSHSSAAKLPPPLPVHQAGDALACDGGVEPKVHTVSVPKTRLSTLADGALGRMPQQPCVRRSDGASEGWCVWGWRVEQTLPVHFENVIEELWVGAVGCKGGMAGGHIRWLLLPLSRDADEYAVDIPCDGSLVDLSQLARGWTGFFLKVVLSGSGAACDQHSQPPPSDPDAAHDAALARACSPGTGQADKMVVSFNPQRYPELFGSSDRRCSGCDSRLRGQMHRNRSGLDLLVKIRLKPRFAKASVPSQDAPAHSTATEPTSGPNRDGKAGERGAGATKATNSTPAPPAPSTPLDRNVHVEAGPPPVPAASHAIVQEKWQSMLRAAGPSKGGRFRGWDASRVAAWVRELAELCDAGGAVAVSSVLQGDEESGLALVMSLLSRPDAGATWGEIERGCLEVLAILMESRSSFHLPALQGPAAADRGSGRGTGQAVCAHPFAEALVGDNLAPLLGGPEAAGVEEGLRALVKNVVRQMQAQLGSASLQQPACRLLAALATIRLPHAQHLGAGARSTALACRVLQQEGGLEALAAALVTHRASCERVAMYALGGALVLARRKQMRGAVQQQVPPALVLEVIARYGMASGAANKAAWLLCVCFAPRLPVTSDALPHSPQAPQLESTGPPGRHAHQDATARGLSLEEEDEEEDEGDIPLNAGFDVILQALLWALQVQELRGQRPLALMGLRHVTLGSLTTSAAQMDRAEAAQAKRVSISATGRVATQDTGETQAQHLNKAQHRMRGFVQLRGLEAVLQACRDADDDACAAPALAENAHASENTHASVGHVAFPQGAVEEEICALLSALLVSNVVDPSQVASLAGGEVVKRIVKWTGRHVENLGVLRQVMCLLGNLVSANARPDIGSGMRPHGQIADRQLVNVAERVVQYGAIGGVVGAQERWEADAQLTGHVLRFLTAVSAVPAPCNAAFSGRPNNSAPGYSSTTSFNANSKTLPRKQVANYFLSDDIRLTGIHDTILVAVRRYQHPLMQQVSALHSLLAHPAWGQSKVLTRDAKLKTKRVLGYRSSAAATYAAASALTSFADNPSFPRTASVPKQLRQVPLHTGLQNSLMPPPDTAK